MSNAGDSMRGMGISSIITAFSSFFADAVSTIRIVNRIISLDSISGGVGMANIQQHRCFHVCILVLVVVLKGTKKLRTLVEPI